MDNGPSHIDVFGRIDEFVANNLNVSSISVVAPLGSQLESGADVSELVCQLLVN